MGYYDWDSIASFESLCGKVLAEVEKLGDDELKFITTEGDEYRLYHSQDCCEHVYIESIVGDLNDLIGEPILQAEEAYQEGTPEEIERNESCTWSFYKLATRKGYVDIRFFGSSNGYYGETASLHLKKKGS